MGGSPSSNNHMYICVSKIAQRGQDMWSRAIYGITVYPDPVYRPNLICILVTMRSSPDRGSELSMEQQLSSDQKSIRPDVLQFTILKKYFLSKNLNGFFVYFIASLKSSVSCLY